MNDRSLDAIFIPFYEDETRWHNDDLAAVEETGFVASNSRKGRMARECVNIDGKKYDFSRFLSWINYDTTVEHRRFDSYSLTLLAGSYYQNYLGRHGFNVHVTNATSRSALQKLDPGYNPRFVMLSTTLLLEKELVMGAVKCIRDTWPDATIILGGLFLVELHKLLPEDKFKLLLRNFGADIYVVSPRGEQSVLEVMRRGSLDAVIEGESIPTIFAVRGREVHAPDTCDDHNLEPEESFISWNETVDLDNLYHTVHTRTARSCSFKCAFCNFPVNQGALTLMPLDIVERELDQLKAAGTVKSLIFTDDTFNVPQDRFKELCKLLGKYEFEWYSFFRPQFADAETVELMKAAHCKAVFMGIESADDQILRNMNKAATTERMKRGIEQLQKHEIYSHASFIVGFPGETEETARKIVSFLDETGIEFFGIAPFYFVPTTPIAQRQAEFGLKGAFENWEHDTMDFATAHKLAQEIKDLPARSIFTPEMAANEFWSQIILYCNGLTLDETRLAFQTFNQNMGLDSTASGLRADPAVQRLKQALAAHEFPPPAVF